MQHERDGGEGLSSIDGNLDRILLSETLETSVQLHALGLQIKIKKKIAVYISVQNNKEVLTLL